jgi:dihydroneopterin aldolase
MIVPGIFLFGIFIFRLNNVFLAFQNKIIMGYIILSNIRTYSFHGCMDEEEKIGAEFRTDVKVKTDLTKAAITDNLHFGLDYTRLNEIVLEEMKIRAKLMETVALRIIERILDEFEIAKQVEVKVTKHNPPVGGNIEAVSVVMKKKR